MAGLKTGYAMSDDGPRGSRRPHFLRRIFHRLRLRRHQQRDEESDHDNTDDFILNATARHVLYPIEYADPPLSNSDNSYVMSLCFSDSHDGTGVNLYEYPDRLPPGSVLVDRIGWVPGRESARYLMMGYRVWTDAGYRLHFHGRPFRYASLKNLRFPQKSICSQDLSESPDLYVQILKLRPECIASEQGVHEMADTEVLPWDVRLPELDLSEDRLNGMNSLSRATLLFDATRVEVARPCYSRENTLCHEQFGGVKLESWKLKQPQWQQALYINTSYPCIGVDGSYLSIKYPSTHVTLKFGDRNSQTLMQNECEDALCEHCQALDFENLFEWGLEDANIDMGDCEELLARKKCSFCRIISALCEDGLDYLKRWQEINPPPVSPYGIPLDNMDARGSFQALFVRNPVHNNSSKPFLVLKQSYHRKYFGPIVSLRTVRGDIRGNYTLDIRQYIDFDVVAKLIKTCESEHGSTCGRKWHAGENPDGFLLVDVNKMCLAQIDQSGMNYITLSYVWGQDRMFTTTRENFKDLLVAGALDRVGLCQTIQDTIAIARALTIAFLWVDTLCIIQDDEQHKVVQIQHMANIYGQSSLTVVALTGNSGSSSLPGVSRPRKRLVEVIQGVPITARFSGLTYNAINQVYEQRAWTFQERLISRRCLYLGERQAFLECGLGETSDHEQLFPTIDRYKSPRIENFNPLTKMVQGLDGGVSGPQRTGSFSVFELSQFNSLITQYTLRKLSFASDIENAFVGVQDVIARKAQWCFIAGLPTGIIDWALLWFPFGELERRRWYSDSPGRPAISPPSWSWFGWDGQVSYSLLCETFQPSLKDIQPLVPSFTLEIDTELLTLLRKPSAIWHEGMFEKESLDKPSNTPVNDNSKMPRLSSQVRMILRFEAEAVCCDDVDLQEVRIEWLNLAKESSTLRTGIRNGYEYKVLHVVSQSDSRSLDLVAMARCTIRHTMRGGTFGEEKTWETHNHLVLMLIRWTEERVAERVAIGYIDAGVWGGLSPRRKDFRLG